ncbi:MAG: VWA domain-containing protein [Verrucomicrobiales bacterium]|nr:VWA domain-containing protein [Verrucomicrobiales bacterium]MCP5556466.1 VWA domain-containing protein [Verrucomicrobiaceae bacterium]
MKLTSALRHALALLVLTCTAQAIQDVPSSYEDKIAPPGFEIIGGGKVTDLPLKSTHAQVNIAGIIAEVTLTQVYANTGSTPIDALYVFPGSTRAAVHGLEFRTEGRTVKAQIQEKAAAKAGYERAKAEGKRTTLLEQHRPNVFQMSLANIAPGAEIEVVLTYTEELQPTDRTYEFIFPGPVGPRYSRAPDSGSQETWVKNPHLAQGTMNPATLHLNLTVHAGMPIENIACPTHDVNITFPDAQSAALTLLHSTTSDATNRDLIVRYRLAGNKVATGLTLHEGTDENFFLLQVQPPAAPSKTAIVPKDFLFVIDVSGSMNGFPLETAKKLMRDLFADLRDEDVFNVLLFAGASQTFQPQSVPATAENITQASDWIQRQSGGGGTELLPALQRALALPKDATHSRSILLITDGFVDIETDVFDLLTRRLNESNIFAFGIGSSVNRHLIEGIAHVGRGEPFIVTNPSEATTMAARLRKHLAAPVLTGLKVEVEGMEIYDLQPAILPDVFADRPVHLIGKYRGKPSGALRLTGQAGHQPWTATIDVAAALKSGTTNPALRSLWAREKVRVLSDYARLSPTAERTREITTLGLTYSLLTDYTSFLAVDDRPQTLTAAATPVLQPSPLPQGVSSMASSGTSVSASGTTPEPGVASLLLFSILTLMLQRQRKARR